MLKNYALSPQRRHSSGQPLEQQQQLEEIAESGEPEEGELHHHQQLRPAHFCNAAKAGGNQSSETRWSLCNQCCGSGSAGSDSQEVRIRILLSSSKNSKKNNLIPAVL
jgi:hypothetical protein